MERYKTRDGVVQTEICGEYLLVAARALQELCPYVTIINESSAFLWNQLKNGATVKDLERAVAEEYEVDDPSEARETIIAFLRQMKDMNYIVAERQGEKNEN